MDNNVVRKLTLLIGLIAALYLPSSGAQAMWRGGAANSVLTELDPYAGLFSGICATKRMFSNYTGPLFNVRRQTDQATLDVYPAANGWPDPFTLLTWANQSQLFVTKGYDQTGQGRHCAQATNANQPTINLRGGFATFSFDGFSQWLAPLASYQPIINNASGLSSVVVRAKDTADTTASYFEFSISTSASANALQFGTGTDPAVNNQEICEGRRLTTDGLIRVTSSPTAFPPDTAWHVQICRVDYNSAIMKYQTTLSDGVVKNPFSTAGLAPAANALDAHIGPAV
jgi:hypothetical protein